MKYPQAIQGEDAHQVADRVERFWDVDSYYFPVPDHNIFCPHCSFSWRELATFIVSLGVIDLRPSIANGGVQLSRVSYHTDEDGTFRYWADVIFKCKVCSRSWPHGVPVPPDSYDKAKELHGEAPTLDYKYIRDYIKFDGGG